MMKNVYTNLYRKHIRRYRGSKTEPWRWLFGTQAALQSVSSAGLLVLDRLRFALKRSDIKLLYANDDSIHFDITCINLLRRPDKRQFIEKQFGEAGFDFKIFPAVDGLEIDTDQLIKDGILAPDNFCPVIGMPLIPAQIGAYLSHYELWKTALKSSNKVSLILEDDALMVCDKSTLEEFVRHIPADTDLFFINRRRNKIKHISLHASKFACDFWGLTAYFLTKQGAEKLINLSLPIRKSADESINELNKNGMIKCYCSRQELIVECSNAKDTQNFRFASDIIDRTKK